MTLGKASSLIIKSQTFKDKRLPILPAGWFCAYCKVSKFLAFINAITNKSPTIICVTQEIVGTILKGHNSFKWGISIMKSEALAKRLLLFITMDATLVPRFRNVGSIAKSSSLSPLLLKNKITSSFVTKPISPCKALFGDI